MRQISAANDNGDNVQYVDHETYKDLCAALDDRRTLKARHGRELQAMARRSGYTLAQGLEVRTRQKREMNAINERIDYLTNQRAEA